MSLGTTDGFNLWSACVNYISDENLNIYFISGNYTNHAINIVQNNKISMSVAGSKQINEGDKLVFQARGFCGKLDESRTTIILDKWNAKFKSKTMNIEDMKRTDSSMFKIVLTKAKYINTNLEDKVLEFDF